VLDGHRANGEFPSFYRRHGKPSTIDPTGCGYAGAQMWQREQNAIVTFPGSAPVNKLQVDFSTSSLADPGAPTAIV